MSRSIEYRYKVVIYHEDENKVSVEFESPDTLSEEQQIKRAEEILSAVKDYVEEGLLDIEVQQPTVLQVETKTYYEP